MITQEKFSFFFLIAWCAHLFLGFLMTFFGHKMRGLEKGFTLGSLFLFLVLIGFYFQLFIPLEISDFFFFGDGLDFSRVPYWLRLAWFQDAYVFWAWVWMMLLGFFFFVFKNYYFVEDAQNRFLGALMVGMSGVTLAWFSETPWMGFSGVILCLLGGCFSFIPSWSSPLGALLFTYFLRERSLGLIALFLGCCLLSQVGTTHFFSNDLSWLFQLTESQRAWMKMGLMIFFLGLFSQFQSFPLTRSWVYEFDFNPVVRSLLHQILPVWAVYAFLVRLYPLFVELQFFPRAGIFILISVALVLLVGFFQKTWNLVLGIWMLAGFTLSLVLLVFGGPAMGMSLLIGMTFSSLAFSALGFCLERKETVLTPPQKTGIYVWLFFCLAGGMGFFGFLSSYGILRALIQGLKQPFLDPFLGLFILVLGAFFCLGWKLFWKMNLLLNFCLKKKKDEREQDSLRSKRLTQWIGMFCMASFVICSFGFLWTGSLSGGSLPIEDVFFSSLLLVVFKPTSSLMTAIEPEDLLLGWGAYGGLFLLAWMSSYALFRREKASFFFSEHFPKITQFIASGYSLDRFEQRFYSFLRQLFFRLASWTDQLFKGKTLLYLFFQPFVNVSHSFLSLDQKMVGGISTLTNRSTQLLGRLLQRMQIGDLRWYLWMAFFSICCMILVYLPW